MRPHCNFVSSGTVNLSTRRFFLARGQKADIPRVGLETQTAPSPAYWDSAAPLCRPPEVTNHVSTTTLSAIEPAINLVGG